MIYLSLFNFIYSLSDNFKNIKNFKQKYKKIFIINSINIDKITYKFANLKIIKNINQPIVN